MKLESLNEEYKLSNGPMDNLFKKGWMRFVGHVSDVDVSRVSLYLEKRGIVKREVIKMGKGVPPTFNSLRKILLVLGVY